MRIEIPRDTERFGAVLIHGVQNVLELDSSLTNQPEDAPASDIIQRISADELNQIASQMAIVVPMRGERIKLVEGVLCGIPNNCLVIVASNSSRHPVDRFAMEREAFERFSRFTNKKVMVVHQKDPAVAEAFRQAGYGEILDPESGLVRNGKAEGMILATLLARLAGRNYVGFIDSDNYFPGAVLEYIHEYAAGFLMAKSRYAMVRISWHSKPKIIEDGLFFAKWGRTSRNTNRLLNSLLAEYTGFETEIIKTGNAGEHALTMDLAMQLRYSSGYSIEPYHYIDLFEQFGGLSGTTLREEVIQEHVEIFQIASRNPHMHDTDKGDDHIGEMTYAAMQVIYHSPICPKKLKQELLEKMRSLNLLEGKEKPVDVRYYAPLWQVDLAAFAAALADQSYTHLLKPDPAQDLPKIEPVLPEVGQNRTPFSDA
jgi:mannosyl-3-phosphoglycerate synthase